MTTEPRSASTAPVTTGLLAKAAYVAALTLATVIICAIVPPTQAGGESGVVMDLPAHIGNLYDYDEPVSPTELYILPKDTEFARKTYGDVGTPREFRILCSIILSGAERRSIHRPERCLPGQGWRIDRSTTETVPLASGHQLQVTALLLDRNIHLQGGSSVNVRTYYLYWFVGHNIATPSTTVRILYTYWDALVERINQRWAYVIVSKDIPQSWDPNGETADQTLGELKQFIHDAVPTFMKSEMPADTAASK
jgi:hypothetical protein